MSKQRKWALVMGSGGVKSVAALGVAQALEETGHRPGLIVGCSAGALFGAMLACGHGAARAIEMAHAIWTPEVARQRRNSAWLELAGSALGVPSQPPFDQRFGLRDGGPIEARLRDAFGDRHLEDLPLELRVVATNAADGRTVLLREGPIWKALRASMALPFLFPAFTMQALSLVDGSVSDPLPLSGADDAAVRVAVGFAVPVPRKVDGPTRLATRITASLTNNLMHAQLAAHTRENDVVLLPALPRRVGLFETQAMPELVALGLQAAQEAMPRLRQALASLHPEPLALARAA